MASMINVVSKELIVLTPYYAFGRNAAIVHRCIPQQDVSQSHATIFWSREGWFLRDHSRNGTLVDNELLRQSVRKLSKKHQIRFGSTDNTCWNIVDLQPPVLSPQDYPEETIDLYALTRHAVFLFLLSPNEEHIRLQLRVSAGQLIDLGSRAHNYLLLALARKRLADHLLKQSPEEQGWLSLDALIKDMSKEMQKEIDVYFINLQIFRLRKQLYEQLSFGQMFANVVERRMGEVRLGHPFFSISKGSEDLGSILP